jgi:hypothetical protein
MFVRYHNTFNFIIHQSNGARAQIRPWPPLLRFINRIVYTRNRTPLDETQRPLPTQNNTTKKQQRRTLVRMAEETTLCTCVGKDSGGRRSVTLQHK